MNIFFGGDCVRLPMITLVDEVTIAPPYVHYKRKPNEFILYYIYDGEMYLTEDTTEYILKPGDTILLDPSRTHYGREASICHYIYIHFLWENFTEKEMDLDQYAAQQIMERHKNSSIISDPQFHSPLYIPKYYTIPEKKRQTFRILLKNIKEAFHQRLEYSQETTAACLMQFMYEYSRIITNQCLDNKELPGIDQRIDAVLTYLKRYYYLNISSQLIEEKFHINYDYLNRQFKKAVGQTIFQYLNAYRVEQSKAMLKIGYYTNQQIAQENGFCNEFYFSRVFKKYTGMSPSTFKKNSS